MSVDEIGESIALGLPQTVRGCARSPSLDPLAVLIRFDCLAIVGLTEGDFSVKQLYAADIKYRPLAKRFRRQPRAQETLGIKRCINDKESVQGELV